jgi:hypothetical protein
LIDGGMKGVGGRGCVCLRAAHSRRRRRRRRRRAALCFFGGRNAPRPQTPPLTDLYHSSGDCVCCCSAAQKRAQRLRGRKQRRARGQRGIVTLPLSSLPLTMAAAATCCLRGITSPSTYTVRRGKPGRRAARAKESLSASGVRSLHTRAHCVARTRTRTHTVCESSSVLSCCSSRAERGLLCCEQWGAETHTRCVTNTRRS